MGSNCAMFDPGFPALPIDKLSAVNRDLRRSRDHSRVIVQLRKRCTMFASKEVRRDTHVVVQTDNKPYVLYEWSNEVDIPALVRDVR